MILRIDRTLDSNSTAQYWERVLVDSNDTDTNNTAYIETRLTFSTVETNVTSDSLYFVVYESTLLPGGPSCCTPLQEQQGVCKQSELPNPELYFLFVKKLEFGAQHVQKVDHKEILTESGTYITELISCDGKENELKMEGTITWRSSHGFLFPEEFPTIVISEAFAGIYFLVLTFFGALCVFYRASLFKIHYFITATLALYVTQEILWAFYYNLMNKTGEFSMNLLGFVVFVHIVAQTTRLLLMIFLATGLGTSVSLVKTAKVRDYDVINLGGFGSDDEDSGSDVDPYKAQPSGWCSCFSATPSAPSCDKFLILRLVLFCVINFIFQFVDAMQSAAYSFTEEDLLGKAWSLSVTIGVLGLTLFFYLWVVFSLINTFRFLKGHPTQLRDYKLFLIFGIIAMLLGVGIMGYSAYSKVLQGSSATDIEQWNAIWENKLVWDIVTCFLLLSIAFIWNPYRSSAFNRSSHVA
eukprot:TRINITY_DN12925_c0_g1_i1.p1 TRINITY_DN12925_c0_g1~~TRINITY_DN12925_c0_g1_i1.p1  ORF type:complete len:488 (-),score=95.19 TRINITY_DN12925_c0_g1_i1:138-1538(-)